MKGGVEGRWVIARGLVLKIHFNKGIIIQIKDERDDVGILDGNGEEVVNSGT